MIRLMAAAAMFGVLQLGTGCRHVGGECDCAPVPGDSVGINPHLPNYGAHGYAQPASLPPIHATAPAISSIPPAYVSPPAITSTPAATTIPPSNSGFEPIAPPKTMPPQR